jgi:hypothetical protein
MASFGDLPGQFALALTSDYYTRLSHSCFHLLRFTTMRLHSAMLCHLIQGLEDGYLDLWRNVRHAYIALELYTEPSAVVY